MQPRSVLVSEHIELSTLGSEAVAAAEALGARVLASNRDDSPGIRQSQRTARHRVLDDRPVSQLARASGRASPVGMAGVGEPVAHSLAW